MEMKDFVTGTYGTMYYVANMEKSTAYYKALLGKDPEFASPEWTSFDLGGSNLCLHNTDGKKDLDGNGILIMNTKNLQATIPALKAMGVEFVTEYKSVCDGGYAIDARDPSGNVISFFEYTGV